MRNSRFAVQHQGTMKKDVFRLWPVLHMKCFWFAGRGAVVLYACMFWYVIPTVRCWLSPLSGVFYLSGWAELMRLSTFRELKPRVQANTDQVSLFSVLIRWTSALPNTRTVCQWNRWSRTGFRTSGVPFHLPKFFFCFLLQARISFLTAMICYFSCAAYVTFLFLRTTFLCLFIVCVLVYLSSVSARPTPFMVGVINDFGWRCLSSTWVICYIFRREILSAVYSSRCYRKQSKITENWYI